MYGEQFLKGSLSPKHWRQARLTATSRSARKALSLQVFSPSTHTHSELQHQEKTVQKMQQSSDESRHPESDGAGALSMTLCARTADINCLSKLKKVYWKRHKRLNGNIPNQCESPICWCNERLQKKSPLESLDSRWHISNPIENRNIEVRASTIINSCLRV